MKSYLVICIIIFASGIVIPQQVKKNNEFSGNLLADAKLILNNYQETQPPQMNMMSENKKSPILAGVFSLIIPGSGEIYAGEYFKAGIFLAIETAVITTAFIYDKKGDDKTTEFENYADDYTNPDHNWSVVRYAEWLNQYGGKKDEIQIPINPDESLPPWKRVDWSILNSAETGTHKLPLHGDQQYYELIGKYPDYSVGWNDYSGGENYLEVSANLLYYSQMRGDANDLYAIASTAIIGIYVNHFLSALDAVWSSVSYNKDLAVKLRLDNIQLADGTVFYPALHLTYSF